MNIRKAVSKGLLTAAISGALAIVPMAVSTRHRARGLGQLGRHRAVRVGRQLVHQHRKRSLRWPAVQAGDLVVQRRRRQPLDRLARGADPGRRERPSHPGPQGLAEVRPHAVPLPRCGTTPECLPLPSCPPRRRAAPRCPRPACSASSTRARCAPRCSTRWARWRYNAEFVALRVDEHSEGSARRVHCHRLGTTRSSSTRTNFQMRFSQPADPDSHRGVPSGPSRTSAPTTSAHHAASSSG